MYAFLIAIHVIASIILVAVILLQAGKGGGLSESFGGGGAIQNIFGSSSQTVMTKVTAGCAILFIVTSLSLTILTSRRSKSLIDLQSSVVKDIVVNQKVKAAARPAASPRGEPAASQPKGIAVPAAAAQAQAPKTVTVKEVKVDPATGKETVVKEEKMTPEEAAKRQVK